jgi:hypothetical protein
VHTKTSSSRLQYWGPCSCCGVLWLQLDHATEKHGVMLLKDGCRKCCTSQAVHVHAHHCTTLLLLC